MAGLVLRAPLRILPRRVRMPDFSFVTWENLPNRELPAEPISNFVPELVGEVLEVIRNLAKDGMTMLVVTHEMQFAREVGTRIVFMDGGRIVEEAAPQVFFTSPRHDRSREFLRRVGRGNADQVG